MKGTKRSMKVSAGILVFLLVFVVSAWAQSERDFETILDWTLEAPYGDVRLSSGFYPDPTYIDILAGGSVDASTIGFSGHFAHAPDLDLYYTAQDYVLYIYVASQDDDTLLVVRDPKGNYWYSDDRLGLRPGIRFGTPMSGLYDIWVGTYDGNYVDSTLAISEIRPDNW